MFIQTEATPNPAMLKFLPDCPVMGEAAAQDFPNRASAKGVALVERLFDIKGVAHVFLGADFITIGKEDALSWEQLTAQLLAVMTDYLSTGAPIMPPAAKREAGAQHDDPIVGKICRIIDTHIRPAVAADGGDIVFDRFEGGVVWLQLRGACAGCPASSMTLKQGVENLLRHYVPAVQEVRAQE